MLSQVSQLLANDHDQLDELLTDLEAALQAGEVKISHAKLDLFWARLAVHIRAEHLHVFPRLLTALKKSETVRQGVPPAVNAASMIDHLGQDHDFFMHELAGAVAMMREVRTTLPANLRDTLEEVGKIVNGVRQRLAAHNETEELQVYRWLSELLDVTELVKLESEVSVELGKRPSRFSDSAWKE